MYTYLMIFSHFRSLTVRKSACVNVFWLSSENQSTRDKVSSIYLYYLPATVLEDQGGPPTWRLHSKIYTFAHNISTIISTLAQRTNLKLGELSALFIDYNNTIS